jgi:hypothetical protein
MFPVRKAKVEETKVSDEEKKDGEAAGSGSPAPVL